MCNHLILFTILFTDMHGQQNIKKNFVESILSSFAVLFPFLSTVPQSITTMHYAAVPPAPNAFAFLLHTRLNGPCFCTSQISLSLVPAPTCCAAVSRWVKYKGSRLCTQKCWMHEVVRITQVFKKLLYIHTFTVAHYIIRMLIYSPSSHETILRECGCFPYKTAH